MGARGYENGFKLTLHPERLEQPLQRKSPTTYFVNSMSDLFHEEVPDAFIEAVLRTCQGAQHHTFQILTKRSERLPVFFRKRTCPTNVVLGVSVEDQKYGLPRIDDLRKVKAKTRFLSVEPLLEDLGPMDLKGIHWIIVGGESGPGARPMDPSWAANVRDQAVAAGVPFFFKQWGAWGADGIRRNKKVNGRDLEGRHWDEYPV
jgi:protein gp37